MLNTLNQRINNQLIELGKLSTDRMVAEESQRLATLRLIANIQGVSTAIVAQDVDQLRELVLPIAVSNHEEAIEIVNSQGISVLSLRHDDNDNIEQFRFTQGDTIPGEWLFVRYVLQGRIDNGRDKYAEVVQAPWGTYFYVAGPVTDDTDQIVGAILVGTPLDRLAAEFRSDTLAQTTFYALDGRPLASSHTLFDGTNTSIWLDQVTELGQRHDGESMLREIEVGSIIYREIVTDWQVRNDLIVGYLGAAIPPDFIVNANEITVFQIVIVVITGVALVWGLGVYISRYITRPLFDIVNASRAVAHGNLTASVPVSGDDEITELANAFNQMLNGLRAATKRRFREIKLRQSLQHEQDLREMKSRFVSMVSHEFRTPLASILSSSEYLENYAERMPPEKLEKHYRRIESSVQNMTRLLEDVLIIGRAESGRLEFAPTAVDVSALCRDIVDAMHLATSNQHAIRFSCKGDPVPVLVDDHLLRIALSNLLSNAMKYSPECHEIDLKLVIGQDSIALQVTDYGIGIPKDDQKHLFEHFYRASNVGAIAGTGLGLHIVKLVVELHNGHIKLKSREGVGTSILVRIPRIDIKKAHDA